MDAPVVRDQRSPRHRWYEGLGSLPNLLTLSRPLLGGAVWLARGNSLVTFGLVVAAGLTDVLDGWVARRRERTRGRSVRESTESIGVWLDPLCDKIFVVLALGAIWDEVQPPLAWLAVILTRELLLIPLFVAYRLLPAVRQRRRYHFQPAFVGKVTTVAQFLAASAFVFDWSGAQALALLAGTSGLGAAIHYATRGQRWPADDIAATPSAPHDPEATAQTVGRTRARP